MPNKDDADDAQFESSQETLKAQDGCLYDTPPALIITDPSFPGERKRYYNQVGGCACIHVEADGVLVLLPDQDSPCFNPSRWYFGVYGIDNCDIYDLPGYEESYKRILGYRKEFGWGPSRKRGESPFKDRENPEYIERGQRLAWAANAKVGSEILLAVNKALESLPGYGTFHLEGIGLKTEAWMESVVEYQGKVYPCILTWTNCD